METHSNVTLLCLYCSLPIQVLNVVTIEYIGVKVTLALQEMVYIYFREWRVNFHCPRCIYTLHTHHSFAVFNVGEYRRQNCGASKSHDFYHPNNEEAKRQRM